MHLEKIQCLLSNAQVDKSFWAKTLVYANHLMNKLPASMIGGKTPLKFGQVELLKTIIYYGYLDVPPTFIKEGKLDLRAKELVFLGVKFFSKATSFGTTKIRSLC